MVTCMSLDFFGEHQKALEDGRYNIYLLYTFAINQVNPLIDELKEKDKKEKEGKAFVTSPSPECLITAADIAKSREVLTVDCVVSMFRRKKVGNSNQMIEFNLRTAHKNMFYVRETFDIKLDHTTGRRFLELKDRPPTPRTKDLLPGVAGYDPVTKQCVPAGEKKRANQRYHQIEEGLDKVYREEVKLGHAWERPFIHRMILSPKQGLYLPSPLSSFSLWVSLLLSQSNCGVARSGAVTNARPR